MGIELENKYREEWKTRLDGADEVFRKKGLMFETQQTVGEFVSGCVEAKILYKDGKYGKIS